MPNKYLTVERELDTLRDPEPEAIFTVECWGGGNYFLNDHVRGKCIRLTSETYWAIIEHFTNIISQSLINGGQP